MSETEPIPPTSSVTALRIPIIKKGEYDLWSMKMRQYIAITDHILWDIITNGNQTTTDPTSPSVSAPKTSLAANARRNNEKALNILLSAIPDRHLLSFHDAVDARSLWKAIKARFGGNEASKKLQMNLLKHSLYLKQRCQCSNCVSHSDEIICFLLLPKQAYMPTTHDDEDLLQIDEDAMEEIDIRWQVAMITARIRKFMRKTGRSIDLKPKNGITFDKKTEQMVVMKKWIVAIEDQLKSLGGNRESNEDIDWTNGICCEINMQFGQRWTDDFDWSQTKLMMQPISLAFEATNKRYLTVPIVVMSYKLLLEKYQKKEIIFQSARNEILEDLKDYAIIDSGCSGSMTGDKDKLSYFKEFKGVFVAFGNDSKERESSGAYIALPGLHSKMAVAERKIGLLLKLLMKSLMGRSPNISVMRHFGCSSDILNTLDHLVKFDGKSEEGYCWPLLQEERTAAKEVNLSSEVMLYMDEISWLELNGFVVTREINGLRGTIIKKKAIASCKRVRQEEGVDYDEGFAPVARIDLKQSDSFWIAFFQGFTVYQMDAKCFFVLHITGKRYMSNSPRFEDLLIHTRSTELSRHFMACIKPQEHVGRIEEISCWYKNIKPASTPIKAHKSLGKDEEGEDVDVHLYRSMIGCLMYLTASRPDIMFAVCLCARFQVTPKVSHLHGSFSDSDYAGDNHDRRSTLGGCQYLGRKIVSWPMHETNNCGISLQKQNM
ncbi:hypothetical protein Tco_0475435 [Tanacetum coccineum]